MSSPLHSAECFLTHTVLFTSIMLYVFKSRYHAHCFLTQDCCNELPSYNVLKKLFFSDQSRSSDVHMVYYKSDK